MSALRLWMPMTIRGFAWTRWMARTGGTWTCSTPVASALGGVAVEVPQIQFIDAVVLDQFQFLDKFMVGPLLCNDSCRCSFGCSTLTSIDVLA